MNIHLSTLLKHYKREDVREAIVTFAQDREIGVLFGEKGFGKRPDVLKYPNDVLTLAQQGATSFHCSEERWSNPLQISTQMKRNELDALRAGWDLILDIDCPVLEYSKIASDLIVKALEHHSISAISVKFSGNHGFHIGVPFETFPAFVQDKEVKDLFPEGPRKIAEYLSEMIRERLIDELLSYKPVQRIAEDLGKEAKELVENNTLDPFKIVSIDTILIASRHLYRMPYSFNEKSGLVSVPIKKNKILEFKKEAAAPERVEVKEKFLAELGEKEEASGLFLQAFDFTVKKTEEGKKEFKETEFEAQVHPISERFFPPCVKLMLKGIEDGKKRAVFALINFMRSVGWSYERIEQYLREWNAKNKEPLREGYIISQLRYHQNLNKNVLPPNCDNKMYYVSIGVCKPDEFCKKIKNPANYTILKRRINLRDREGNDDKEEENAEKEVKAEGQKADIEE